jgi:hypothetical protein
LPAAIDSDARFHRSRPATACASGASPGVSRGEPTANPASSSTGARPSGSSLLLPTSKGSRFAGLLAGHRPGSVRAVSGVITATISTSSSSLLDSP